MTDAPEEVFHSSEWPHGLICAVCDKPFEEGQPINHQLDRLLDDVPVLLVTCMECGAASASHD